MNKDLTLVVLAAGMGSRFGSLKQIEPVGPNDELIIDYSIYDAINAGFNKVVFIIKEENYDTFKNTIGVRIEPYIKTEYVFQKNDNLPKSYDMFHNRIKPLGTAHAILCCKKVVKEPFMTINADDFYGSDAFIKGAEFLKNHNKYSTNEYGMVTYYIGNSINGFNEFSRGMVKAENNYLTNLVESKVKRNKEGSIDVIPLNKEIAAYKVNDSEMVNMNMLLFNTSIFEFLEKKLSLYLDKAISNNNIDIFEFLITDVLSDAISEGYATCRIINSVSNWYGVTYKEDLPFVKESIKELIQKKVYPDNLWKK